MGVKKLISMDRNSIEQSNSIHGIIIKFLNKEPATMKEITEHVLQQRDMNTKTPGHTIRGVLQRSKFIKKNIFAKYELVD